MNLNFYILPVSFIIIGFLLMKYTPRYTNRVFGYKSLIFMKNKDAWNEGNHFFGKIIMIGGFILIILFVILNYFYANDFCGEKIAKVGPALTVIISIIYTEVHLFIKFKNKKN